jgi:hypothetical protein
MPEIQSTQNGIKTTVGELMHFGLWSRYCRLMHLENGCDSLDEEIFLPDEMLELLGV